MRVFRCFYFFNKFVTILSLICCDGKQSSFCKKYERSIPLICPLCYIPLYFHNFHEESCLNRTYPIFLVNYRDKRFPLSIECYVTEESSISLFAEPFCRKYHGYGNTLKAVSFTDLSVT